ncbi:hypothetical protein [Providencia sp. CRPN17576]
MGSCAAPSAKGDDKFITTDYLQQCLLIHFDKLGISIKLKFREVEYQIRANNQQSDKAMAGLRT